MAGISRSFLLSIALIGLGSCVQTPKPVSIEERNTFVHVAVVHRVPESQTDPLPHIHKLLDKAGVRHFIDSSSEEPSIFVEPKRSNEASRILAKDVMAQENYRLTIDFIRIDDPKEGVLIKR